MQFVKVIVLSVLLIMPGLAYGMGMNPFSHSEDHPGAHPTNKTLNTSNPTGSVPEPATALTVGTGLLALAAWRRYRS